MITVYQSKKTNRIYLVDENKIFYGLMFDDWFELGSNYWMFHKKENFVKLQVWK